MRISLSLGSLLIASVAALSAANVAAGGAAYDKSCKTCHGADGTANPEIADMMKVAIPDLKSPQVQGMSEADLKAVITNGKGKMPVTKAVTGPAVDDVVAYVHSLKK